ncbi:hypothetical protein E2C01_003197 [Portunus trituberculatus]|uniref:Uncharacterized protein n=1 Tax=Portunus trituberculatus TaxID=210409 RepID=A0A5B7CP47_PORTR|nr:hypothetical protein [Portunus trituberculatus]
MLIPQAVAAAVPQTKVPPGSRLHLISSSYPRLLRLVSSPPPHSSQPSPPSPSVHKLTCLTF